MKDILETLEQRRAQAALHCPEPGADDHGGPAAALAELSDQARHAGGRRGDHRQIGGDGQLREAVIGQGRADRPFARVHRHHRSGEAAFQQVARQHRPHGLRTIAGADQGDRPGLEQGVEVAGGHPFGSSS